MPRDAMPALGSATHTCAILNERVPWGGPQFYPRGEPDIHAIVRTVLDA